MPLDTRQALLFALEKYPERTEIVSLAEVTMESARRNDKRPAWVKVALPDEIVKAVRSPQGDGDLLVVVRVPKDVLSRSESRIVLPGEVR